MFGPNTQHNAVRRSQGWRQCVESFYRNRTWPGDRSGPFVLGSEKTTSDGETLNNSLCELHPLKKKKKENRMQNVDSISIAPVRPCVFQFTCVCLFCRLWGARCVDFMFGERPGGIIFDCVPVSVLVRWWHSYFSGDKLLRCGECSEADASVYVCVHTCVMRPAGRLPQAPSLLTPTSYASHFSPFLSKPQHFITRNSSHGGFFNMFMPPCSSHELARSSFI